MTRFTIDPPVAIRLAREETTVAPGHQLVAPGSLRSACLGLLYAQVRAGELTEREARVLLDRIAGQKVRLLADRVSRWVAWRIATEHGRRDTGIAEYLAVTRLQADALVALDPEIRAAAEGVVPLAGYEDLLGG